jgi:hypothetical protein
MPTYNLDQIAAGGYRFVDQWNVQGTVEEVTQILNDPEQMIRWWPCAYLDVRETATGDPNTALGKAFNCKVQGWLPYRLKLSMKVTEVNHPNGSTLECTGDLEGKGIWTHRQEGPRVHTTYEWNVYPTKWFIRYGTFILKRLFGSNHHWVMGRGETSLQLELERRRAKTPEDRARIPAPPGPARTASMPFKMT